MGMVKEVLVSNPETCGFVHDARKNFVELGC